MDVPSDETRTHPDQLTGADVRPEPAPACKRCRVPFDPTDKRYDGHAEERALPGYCRHCVDLCHDNDIADHRCAICAPPTRPAPHDKH